VNADTLIETVRDAVATDDDLSAWCTAQFGALPTVYVDVDEASPPDEGDYPLIALHSHVRSGGTSKNAMVWELDFGCGVFNATRSDTETAGGVTVRTYTGMLQAARLAELVERAAIGALAGVIRNATFSSQCGQISEYPFFAAFTTLTAEQVYTSRSSRFS